MNDRDELLKRLDESWRPVVRGARATVRHLKEWTGEYRGAVPGASTSSGPPPAPRDDDGDDGRGRVVLTKLEASALGSDMATVKLRELFGLLVRLVHDAEILGAFAGVEVIPRPDRRLESQTSYVQWQINKARQAPGRGAIPGKFLVGMLQRADHLSRIVTVNAPARTPSGLPAGGCVCHARANEWAEVDDRYRRHQLCRRCGDFRTTFGHLPLPALVRWAEKHGWRSALSPSTRAKFDVKPRQPKRRRKG